MSTDTLQAYVALAGLILAMVGLPILVLQIRALQRSVRSGAHAAMYAQAADVRSHLVEYPQLRKYFFDGVEIGPDNEEYDRVVTIAELFLNYLEHIAVMEDSFGRGNRAALQRFVDHALDRSPILRRRLSENPAAYSDALRVHCGVGAGSLS
jgi:hypothetical protein